MVALHNFGLFSILIAGIYSEPEDVEVIVTSDGLNEAAPGIIPMIEEEMLKFSTDPQTMDIEGHEAEIGAVSVQSFTIEDIILTLNATSQQIAIDTYDVQTTMNDIPFSASIKINQFFLKTTISCSGYISAVLSNWNISLTEAVSTDNCSVSLDQIDSQIYEGDFDIGMTFESVANAPLGIQCSDVFGVADSILDIEELLIDEFVNEIPPLIQQELENALSGEGSSGDSGDVEVDVCIANVTIYDDRLLVAGDLEFALDDIESVLDDNPFDESLLVDDASLISFFVAMMILSSIVGCGVGAAAFWGCYKESFRMYYHKEEDGKQLKQCVHDGSVQMGTVNTNADVDVDVDGDENGTRS